MLFARSRRIPGERADHSGIRVIGHGVQAGDAIYCCAHCAEQEGATGLEDRTA